MKSTLEQENELLSTTTERINNLQVKENNHLFNHIDKLSADHDVRVSNTMIKITYKKALKDQNVVDGTADGNTDSDFSCQKKKLNEAPNLCVNNISVIVKSPKLKSPTEGNKGLMFHSTPKPEGEKKKKYANGLNLPPKTNHSVACMAKVQKTQEGSSSSPKKLKTVLNKQIIKAKSDKRFLKGNGLVKLKTSISQKNGGDARKKKLTKVSDKKIKKLENGVKKKIGVDKQSKKIGGLKRKSSSSEFNVSTKYKKVKFEKSKLKETEDKSLGEVTKSASKKQVMLVDPDLPSGWTRFIRTKNKGSDNEQYVVYVVNPQGKKFRFKWKLRKYLQRTNSPLDANQFFFGLYQRPKMSNTSQTERDEEKSKGKMPATRVLNDVQTSPTPEDSGRGKNSNSQESNNDGNRSSDSREILFYDPDLPFGWRRVIHSNSANGRKQVHIISPDGKIFRRRYRLNEYLIKHQYTHNLDRFYFGLYPKKEGSSSENFDQKSSDLEGRETEETRKTERGAVIYDRKTSSVTNSESEHYEFRDCSKMEIPNSPMYDDPNLPDGWKRFIIIRSCGESAGRMEVVIVSPDGRRHRSRKHLEYYLKQKKLNYKAGDFDFTVFGRANMKKRNSTSSSVLERELEADSEPETEPESSDVTFLGMKKKFTDKPVPELDISCLKESVITPESHLINSVSGLMLCSELSTARNERRQRLPRTEHEKQLKSYLSTENEFSWDDLHIPTCWVQRLVKCRGDFRNLEPDAAATIAETTKEFIKKVALQALATSKQPETGLKYEDIAELVDKTEGLSFLKTLIPKKITFREYIKLNRPKQFMSFT